MTKTDTASGTSRFAIPVLSPLSTLLIRSSVDIMVVSIEGVGHHVYFDQVQEAENTRNEIDTRLVKGKEGGG